MPSDRQVSFPGRHISSSAGVRSCQGWMRSLREGHVFGYWDEANLGTVHHKEKQVQLLSPDLTIGEPQDFGKGMEREEFLDGEVSELSSKSSEL